MKLCGLYTTLGSGTEDHLQQSCDSAQGLSFLKEQKYIVIILAIPLGL